MVLSWLCFQFQHLESVIRARIPSITSLINKSIDEIESEMDHVGRPIAVDAGVSGFHFIIIPEWDAIVVVSDSNIMFQAQLYTILEICRAFDRIFKEHLDGG